MHKHCLLLEVGITHLFQPLYFKICFVLENSYPTNSIISYSLILLKDNSAFESQENK